MNAEEYEHIKTLDEAKKIIANQDMIIGKQLREIQFLQDSVYKRQEWLRKAKKEANYDQNVSFDDVWREVLNKAQSNS
jgi:hypothetical protein